MTKGLPCPVQFVAHVHVHGRLVMPYSAVHGRFKWSIFVLGSVQ